MSSRSGRPAASVSEKACWQANAPAAMVWKPAFSRLAREGREKYQEKYGPLLQTDLTPGSYKWLDNPWPWDLGGND